MKKRFVVTNFVVAVMVTLMVGGMLILIFTGIMPRQAFAQISNERADLQILISELQGRLQLLQQLIQSQTEGELLRRRLITFKEELVSTGGTLSTMRTEALPQLQFIKEKIDSLDVGVRGSRIEVPKLIQDMGSAQDLLHESAVVLRMMPVLQNLQVLDVVKAPGGDIWGVEWDGSFLWVATPGGELYKITTEGEVITSVQIGLFNTGLTWDGSNLWYSSIDTVLKISAQGEVLGRFDFPQMQGAIKWITGLAWDGSALWMIDREDQTINKLDSEGIIIETINIPGDWFLLDGLEYDGSHFWAIDAETNTLLKLSKAGIIVSSFYLPGTVSTDLAYAEGYFWIADIDDNVIRKIDPQYLLAK